MNIDTTKLTPIKKSKNPLLQAKANILSILKQNGIEAGATTQRYAGGSRISVYSKNVNENTLFTTYVALSKVIISKWCFLEEGGGYISPDEFQQKYFGFARVVFEVRLGDKELSIDWCKGDLEQTMKDWNISLHDAIL